ncbi:hypothetical protein VDIAB_100421 [Vibrio diabolicus]|nr:hypothetical protein VDIAB_100421 [Vibrio diabolicus]
MSKHSLNLLVFATQIEHFIQIITFRFIQAKIKWSRFELEKTCAVL